MKALKFRLKALWYVLTGRNFILIHSIKEVKVNGKGARIVATIRRTDYDKESDYLSVLSATYQMFDSAYQNQMKEKWKRELALQEAGYDIESELEHMDDLQRRTYLNNPTQ